MMIIFILTLLLPVSGVYATPVPGDAAPVFSLTDMAGKKFDLGNMADQPMVIQCHKVKPHLKDTGFRIVAEQRSVRNDASRKSVALR